MKKTRPVFLILFFFNYIIKGQTNLNGVVNIYAEVTNIAGPNVNVPSNAGFSVGDKVMIIQMKGTSINTSNTSAYGTISSLNNAGNFEFNQVQNVPGGSIITLTSNPSTAFTTSGSNRVQIVRVRSVVGNANVNGNITATAWNGTIGGIVAIEITGSLTINSGFRISADGAGFRGGAVSAVSDGVAWCNWSEFRSPGTIAACYQGIYAQKGEGVAEDAGFDYARGPLATGGGGSGEHNGGGGGGGNVAPGGDGGRQFSNCPLRRNNTGINCNTPAAGALQNNTCSPAAISATDNVMVGGLGGKSLISGSSNNKIFMGGGGGGGQQNGAGGTSGGNGGGIVVVVTNTLINNSGLNNAISAVGIAAGNTTGNEGAGGGGAGGTILLEVLNIANSITLSVAGGNGGNAVTNNVNCRGPGGGGGGGLIWISGLTTTPVGLTTNVLSGNAGSVVCSSAGACGGVPPATNTLVCFGNLLFCASTPTSNGTVLANLITPLPIDLYKFESHCKSKSTLIHFSTLSERDITKFVIQKSSNAVNWENIGEIGSSAPSSNLKEYFFEDKTRNSEQTMYYRLKLVYSAYAQYSTIIASVCAANSNYDFNVNYENGITLKLKSNPKSIRIYNVLGQLIKDVELDGSTEYSIYSNTFANGIYLISAEFENTTVSKKVLLVR